MACRNERAGGLRRTAQIQQPPDHVFVSVSFPGGSKVDDAGSMDWVAQMGIVQIDVSVSFLFLFF